MKKILLIMLTCVVSNMISGSCSNPDDEECEDGYAPFDCETSPPSYGTLIIEITNNYLNPAVPVIIYSGDFEDGKIAIQDTLSAETSYILHNDYYSVRAEYKVMLDQDLVTVYSVDGGTLDYESESYCDDTCYEEGVETLDATLDTDLF